MLTLREKMWRGEGSVLGVEPIGFEVLGLPESQQAWIVDDSHSWQVLRATNGVQDDWSGQFKSAEEALGSLVS